MHITTDADLHSSKPPRAPAALVRWVWQLAKDVWTEYRTDRVGDLAAAITFWTILSIPAAVLALVSMLSSLDAIVGQSVRENVESELEDFITTTFSDSEALNSTVTELFGTSSAGIATVATLVALFTLSRAFAGLIRALDVAYEIDESRPWWLLRFTAILLGLGTLVNVVAGATLLAVLPVDGILRVFVAPAVFIALVAWAATVFHLGPNHRTPWRYDLPGAIFTAVGWIAASQGLTLYVRAAGQANDVQTTVGAILLALSLMHLLSIVLLIGAELNDVLARRAGVVMSARSVGERARSLREQLEQRNGTPTRID
ncbi:MAG: membrane protein [Acidimicrobiales bacterium]|jgi:membrane protein